MISTLPPPADHVVRCPYCINCRCGGTQWITYEAREEWFERNPSMRDAWRPHLVPTVPPPPQLPRLHSDHPPSEDSHIRLTSKVKAANDG